MGPSDPGILCKPGRCLFLRASTARPAPLMHADPDQRSCLLLTVEQGKLLLFCLPVLFDKLSPDHSHKLERPRIRRADVLQLDAPTQPSCQNCLPQQQRMHREYLTRIAHPCSTASTITTASVNTSTSKTYATKYTAASYLITFDDDEDPEKTTKPSRSSSSPTPSPTNASTSLQAGGAW